MGKNVPIAVAAILMNKSRQFVRCGLQCGKLPIGTALKLTGKNYSYHISPKLLADYLGCTMADIERAALKENQNSTQPA